MSFPDKRYIVYPDRDIGVTFRDLCRLYKVDPRECIDGSKQEQMLGRKNLEDFEMLHVRLDGGYDHPQVLKERKEAELRRLRSKVRTQRGFNVAQSISEVRCQSSDLLKKKIEWCRFAA